VQAADQRGLVEAQRRRGHASILTKSPGRVNNPPTWQDDVVQISARSDYALRALCVLACTPPGSSVKADEIAARQSIPRTFLDGILVELRRAGIVQSRRGPDGGHRLARPASEITVAEVMRVLDGPLAMVRGQRPEAHVYDGCAEHLRDVWVAVRASLRALLEHTTVADIAGGELPEIVTRHTCEERSWRSVWPPSAD
jgi:Rrf2 family protein